MHVPSITDKLMILIAVLILLCLNLTRLFCKICTPVTKLFLDTFYKLNSGGLQWAKSMYISLVTVKRTAMRE